MDKEIIQFDLVSLVCCIAREVYNKEGYQQFCEKLGIQEDVS